MTSPLSRSHPGLLSYSRINQCDRQLSLIRKRLSVLYPKHSSSLWLEDPRFMHLITKSSRSCHQKYLSYPLALISNWLNSSSGSNRGIKFLKIQLWSLLACTRKQRNTTTKFWIVSLLRSTEWKSRCFSANHKSSKRTLSKGKQTISPSSNQINLLTNKKLCWLLPEGPVSSSLNRSARFWRLKTLWCMLFHPQRWLRKLKNKLHKTSKRFRRTNLKPATLSRTT